MKDIMFNLLVVVSWYYRIIGWPYRRIPVSSYLVFTPYSPQSIRALVLLGTFVSRATAIYGNAPSNHLHPGSNYGVGTEVRSSPSQLRREYVLLIGDDVGEPDIRHARVLHD